MGRRAPSLEAVEAFLAAARSGGFQEAAAELALSPSAFSRRIQSLEAFLGQPMFDRSSTPPKLTRAGRSYREAVEPALEAIGAATSLHRKGPSRDKLRVITSHSLALGWLMPKLAGLYERLGLDIELTTGRGTHHLRSGEVDVAIWGGPDDAGDHARDDLVDLDAVPASATVLADRRSPPRRLDDLGRHRLLCARGAPNLWPEWLAQAGYRGPAVEAFVGVETTHLAYESAASGLGVALAVPLLADRFLADRRLSPCVPDHARVPVRYSLIYAQPSLRRSPPVRAFHEWLTAEAERSVTAFQAWTHSSVTA